jgi:sec-independent protein translocase protein TatB
LFDIAFTELFLIAIVALIVIGPERLPKVARTLGSLVGRMQRYVSTVKQDIERELEIDDLKKLQEDIQQGSQDVKRQIENSIHAGMSEAKTVTDESTSQPHESETQGPRPSGRDGQS